MSADTALKEHEVRIRAELAGLSIRPEDLSLVVQGWSLIEPHLLRILAESLRPSAEPAALFKP